jgi:hypothetical protein
VDGFLNQKGVKKKYFRIYPLVVIVSSCMSTRQAHYTPEQKYSTQVLRKDFTLVREALEADHPSLYWYMPKDSIQYYFAQADSAITEPMTELEFRNLLAVTLAHIRCGHTGVRSSRMFDAYTSRRASPAQFPFQVKILPQAPDPELALVFNPYLKDSTFRPGDVITDINGVDAATLITRMRSYLSVDGYSYNFAYQRISGDFPQWYQNVFGADSVFRVGIQRGGGSPLPGASQAAPLRFTASVKAYDLQKDTSLAEALKIWEMGAPYRFSREEELERTRSLKIDSSGKLAVMELRSFADGVRKDFIRQSFRTLHRKKVSNLVIDLRTNTGGVISTAVLLARYLKRDDFVFTDSVYALTRKLAYKRYMDKSFLYQLGLTFLTRKKEDGYYHFRYFEGTRYHPVRKDHYEGHVYILTGGFTFSAASIFTANMKGAPGVTILGEETGGGNYGNDGVFITEITLPGTGLRVSLPLFRMIINHLSVKDGRGVIPDVEVVPTTADIRAGVDPKIRKVREMIGD